MVDRKRSRVHAVVIAVAAIALFASGWILARRFESPAQREASAVPPSAAPLFAVASTGTLADQVSGTGRLVFPSTVPIKVVAVAENAVITARPLQNGGVLRNGHVITQVSGRPVFALEGDFDFYRSLGLGATGPDVRQLQLALESASQTIPSAETRASVLGAGTELALASMYKSAGYAPMRSLPLTEVVIVQKLPVLVQSLAAIGAHLTTTTPIAAAVRGGLVGSVSLDAAAAARVPLGAPASVTLKGGVGPIMARITAIVSTVDENGAGAGTATLSFTDGINSRQDGTTFVAIVTISVVARDALIVPSRAVSTATDGITRVLARRTGSASRSVPVVVVGSLAGRSAVRPTVADQLREGDMVVVG